MIAALAMMAPGTRADEPAQGIETKVLWTRIAGVSAITLWGVSEWQYFQSSPHGDSEGWFASSTAHGGADKLGHLAFSHFLTQGLADLYEHWGLESDNAGKQAALTSLLVMGYMEFGDAFSSQYGFSAEDMAMNVAGSVIGYWLYADRQWRRRLDLRVEYKPRSLTDPFTDYEHTKYLFALKLDAFDAWRGTPGEWLELHAGYYVRDTGREADQISRTLYLGLGVNLARLARSASLERTAALLHYVQPPETTLAVRRELP